MLLVVSIFFHLIVRFKERASLFFGKRLMSRLSVYRHTYGPLNQFSARYFLPSYRVPPLMTLWHGATRVVSWVAEIYWPWINQHFVVKCPHSIVFFFTWHFKLHTNGQVALCHNVINRLPKNKEARSLNLTIRWKEIETTSNTKQLSIHFDRADRSLTCLWCDFLSWWWICRVFTRFQCFQKVLAIFK